jgi:KDO2-lipid IV(A) lauroyltransferase
MKKQQTTVWSLLKPRYWFPWFGISLLWLFAKLPYTWQQSIGKGLGLLAGRILKSRWRIAAVNLRLCFPNLSETEIQQLVRESFIYLGRGVLGVGMAWWSSDRRVRSLLANVSGLENLQRAFAQGKGVILLSGHFSFAEIGARFTHMLIDSPIHVMHREQSSVVFEHVLQKKRLRFFKSIIIRANVRQMLRALKSNEGVFYLPDQNFEQEHSMFVPFMGVNTLTLKATARFAEMNNCVVVPCFCYQRADGKGFDVEYWPALENYPSGDDYQDALRINQVFEVAIKKHPEQYMWLHRRFKIRPPGEPSVY